MQTTEDAMMEDAAWRRENNWEQALDFCVVASTCMILCIMLVAFAMGFVFGLVAWVKFSWKYV